MQPVTLTTFLLKLLIQPSPCFPLLVHFLPFLYYSSASIFSFATPTLKLGKTCQLILRFLFIIDVSIFFIFLQFSFNFTSHENF